MEAAPNNIKNPNPLDVVPTPFNISETARIDGKSEELNVESLVMEIDDFGRRYITSSADNGGTIDLSIREFVGLINDSENKLKAIEKNISSKNEKIRESNNKIQSNQAKIDEIGVKIWIETETAASKSAKLKKQASQLEGKSVAKKKIERKLRKINEGLESTVAEFNKSIQKLKHFNLELSIFIEELDKSIISGSENALGLNSQKDKLAHEIDIMKGKAVELNKFSAEALIDARKQREEDFGWEKELWINVAHSIRSFMGGFPQLVQPGQFISQTLAQWDKPLTNDQAEPDSKKLSQPKPMGTITMKVDRKFERDFSVNDLTMVIDDLGRRYITSWSDNGDKSDLSIRQFVDFINRDENKGKDFEVVKSEFEDFINRPENKLKITDEKILVPKRIAENNETIQLIEKEILQKRKELTELQAKRQSKPDDEKIVFDENIQISIEIDGQIDKLKAFIERLESDIEKLNAFNQELESKKFDLSIREFVDFINRTENKLKNIENKIKLTENAIETQEEKIQSNAERIVKNNGRIQRIENSILLNKGRLNTLQIDEAESIQTLTKLIEKQASDLTRLQSSNLRIARDNKKLSQSIDDLHSSLSDLDHKKERLAHEIQIFKGKAVELNKVSAGELITARKETEWEELWMNVAHSIRSFMGKFHQLFQNTPFVDETLAEWKKPVQVPSVEKPLVDSGGSVQEPPVSVKTLEEPEKKIYEDAKTVSLEQNITTWAVNQGNKDELIQLLENEILQKTTQLTNLQTKRQIVKNNEIIEVIDQGIQNLDIFIKKLEKEVEKLNLPAQNLKSFNLSIHEFIDFISLTEKKLSVIEAQLKLLNKQ